MGSEMRMAAVSGQLRENKVHPHTTSSLATISNQEEKLMPYSSHKKATDLWETASAKLILPKNAPLF